MKKLCILTIVLWLLTINSYSQQTVGLFLNTPESFNGYTLFAPIKSNITYLITNCGEKVHSWNSQYQPGLSCYLLENGVLLRTGKIPIPQGGGGIVEMLDWNSNVIWDYTIPNVYGNQHHDIAMLPNGNILFIVSDERSQAEVIQAGGSTTLSEIKSEQIIEVQPDIENGGGDVVWVWKTWDHLIQDVDNAFDNYGIIAEHPERVDINFLIHNDADWLHINGINYNEEFDQIIISVHNFSEFWIIDHSTTTAEAAGSTGGTYGQGGDLLYRWGNPQAYDQGTESDQKLFLQHHTHWIPELLNDAGKILLFNNQAGNPQGQNYSTVNIVNTPIDANGFYSYTSGAFEPTDFDWTYQAAHPTDFFSNIISGVQRLENGNTLICEGVGGRFFEIDENENIVWEYVNPVNDLGPINQNIIPENNNVFRCTRYAPVYTGFAEQTLVPQGYIEIGSTFSCDLYPVGIINNERQTMDIELYPNPVSHIISIALPERKCHIYIYNALGNLIFQDFVCSQDLKYEKNIANFNNGMYYITIKGFTDIYTEKFIISR